MQPVCWHVFPDHPCTCLGQNGFADLFVEDCVCLLQPDFYVGYAGDMPLNDRLKMRHLRTLLAIAEQGSLVRAAHTLSISQPAVTKTLTELEVITGQLLFERSPKGVTLTAAGRVLVRHAGAGLRTIHDGLSSLSSPEEGEAAKLVIGASPNLAASVVASALGRFAALWPKARLTVRTGNNAQLILALRQGALDMVVGRLAEPSAMQGLSFEHLYTEPLLLVVRPGHELATLSFIDPVLLYRYRLILPDASTTVRESANQFFMSLGGGLPTHTIETNDLFFGKNFVLQSDAVLCIALGGIENELLQGTVVRLPFDTRSTEGPVGVTLRVEHSPSEAMVQVLDEIRMSAAARFGAMARLKPLR
jgi:LysR family pca operon transcriptional activator